MNAIASSIVILAGSILVSVGMLAKAMKDYHGGPGFLFGGILLLIGSVAFLSGILKPAWDAIPVNGKTTGDKKPEGDEA